MAPTIVPFAEEVTKESTRPVIFSLSFLIEEGWATDIGRLSCALRSIKSHYVFTKLSVIPRVGLEFSFHIGRVQIGCHVVLIDALLRFQSELSLQGPFDQENKVGHRLAIDNYVEVSV